MLAAYLLLTLLPLVRSQWEKLETKTTPPGCVPAMTVTEAGTMLYTGSGKPGDTWLFVDGDWQQQDGAPVVPGRGASAVAPYKDGAILFGGANQTDPAMVGKWRFCCIHIGS